MTEIEPGDFSRLMPDVMLDAVEQVLGVSMTGLATPLPSYINRVYEVETAEHERLIAKFYRPGRWSRDALQEEHDFVADCREDEIPVVSPIDVDGKGTLHEADGIYFALFPKRHGRQLEINSPKDWLRVGRLMGRVHVAGSRKEAGARIRLHPDLSTERYVDELLDGGFVAPKYEREFEDRTNEILDVIAELFDETEAIRLHGDCHCGNLLTRPGEGIMIIDFDDMLVGPPVQDLWLLLPGRADQTRRELGLLLRGYEMFREFDDSTIRLIEPLRVMRIIYFLAWCSRQIDDYKFRSEYPDWGSDAFWKREIDELTHQLQVIHEHLA